MPNLEITNNSTAGIVIWEPVYEDAIITFPGASTFPAGAVLAKIDGTDEYQRFNPGLADGREIPKAVLAFELTADGAGDLPVRVIISGRVRREDLSDNLGAVLTQDAIDLLRDYTIIGQTTTQLSQEDNQ